MVKKVVKVKLGMSHFLTMLGGLSKNNFQSTVLDTFKDSVKEKYSEKN